VKQESPGFSRGECQDEDGEVNATGDARHNDPERQRRKVIRPGPGGGVGVDSARTMPAGQAKGERREHSERAHR